MTETIKTLIEPIQNRLNAATPGPWRLANPRPDGRNLVERRGYDLYGGEVSEMIIVDTNPSDAEFIASSPTDQARLLAAVQAGASILDERARELRETADRLNQQVIDRDPDRDIEAAQRYSHYAAQAEAAAYAHRAAVVAALTEAR